MKDGLEISEIMSEIGANAKAAGQELCKEKTLGIWQAGPRRQNA